MDIRMHSAKRKHFLSFYFCCLFIFFFQILCNHFIFYPASKNWVFLIHCLAAPHQLLAAGPFPSWEEENSRHSEKFESGLEHGSALFQRVWKFPVGPVAWAHCLGLWEIPSQWVPWRTSAEPRPGWVSLRDGIDGTEIECRINHEKKYFW